MEVLNIHDMHLLNVDFKQALQLYNVQVLDFRKREFRKIPELVLPSKVTSTESTIYVYEDKNKWNKKLNAIKIFKYQDIINEKIDVIGKLLKYKDVINIDELVMPLALVSIDKVVSGYIMPYVESNINMKVLLDNENVLLKDKIKYLKEMLLILKKIELVHSLKGKFFLGDIHESNFIFDVESQRIKVIDVDSAYIDNSFISASKFMTYNEKLDCFPRKYPLCPAEEIPIHVPNHNSQTLCFMYMLLNTLSGDNSYEWGIEDYYLYLNYLEKNGMNKEVINAFAKAYNKSPKLIFDEHLLDYINPNKDYRLHLSK